MGESVPEDHEKEPVDLAECNAWGYLARLCPSIYRQWFLQEPDPVRERARRLRPLREVPESGEILGYVDSLKEPEIDPGGDAVRAEDGETPD